MGMYQPVEGDRVLMSRIGVWVQKSAGKARYWELVGEDGSSMSFDDEEFETDFWTFDRLAPKLPTTPGSVIRHDLDYCDDILAVLDDDGHWVDSYARRSHVKMTALVFDAGAA